MSNDDVVSHLTTLYGHISDVTCLAFSTTLLATCSSDKSVRVWDIRNPERIITEVSYSPLLGHKYSVHCCSFSPLEEYLASCSTDGNIILWSPHNGENMGTLTHPSSLGIRVCNFSPNSCYLISGGEDDKVVLWDINLMRIIRVINAHEATVTVCCFTPDSFHFISGSTNGDIKLWSVDECHDIPVALESEAHDLGVLSCDFSPISFSEDSLRKKYFLCATSGNDDYIRLWSVSTSLKPGISLHHILKGHEANVMCCRFSPDGKYLATTSGDKSAIIWDLATQTIVQKLWGHARYVTCCAFSTDSRYAATGSNDKAIVIWKFQNATQSEHCRQDSYNVHYGKVEEDENVPNEYLCPITHEVMKDPVIASDGYTYEKHAISDWLQGGKLTSPMTNKILSNTKLLPNHTLKMLIKKNTGK